MYVQTEITPNPNSLKFLPGKNVSISGSHEITNKNELNNDLIRNILSVNGVVGMFLGKDFISINKNENVDWEDIKHVVISLINEFYLSGNEFVINSDLNDNKTGNFVEIEKQIIKILETKIRPAVERDGGDIKFKEFKNGIVKVKLEGSCSGCPSSTMTLKQGVQNLLCHYIPDVKEVIAI
jgi:Fe-S cluster biogenesis protein NfuA